MRLDLEERQWKKQYTGANVASARKVRVAEATIGRMLRRRRIRVAASPVERMLLFSALIDRRRRLPMNTASRAPGDIQITARRYVWVTATATATAIGIGIGIGIGKTVFSQPCCTRCAVLACVRPA